MSFAWPLALVGLVVVPVLVGLYVWHDRRRSRVAERFGNPALLPNVVDREPGRLRYLPLVVLLVALALMIVGVARPHATVNVSREEATVVLALDVSRSMKAEDVEPTRLDAARNSAKAFLEEVPEKFRVGLVTFATRAVVALPPTQDRELAARALDTLKPGEGTAIGDAVALSLQMGRRQREEDGAIPPTSVLVISDGARDGGILEPEAAAERARKLGVPVYTVLVGTPEGVVEETLPGGFRRLIQVPTNPEILTQLAEISGGEFFTAVDDEGLAKVYEELGSRLGTKEEDREITDFFAAGSAVPAAHGRRALGSALPEGPVKALAVLLVMAASVLALGAGSAGAARECDGLMVCVPVAGPWVVVPTGSGVPRPEVQFNLSCPRNYVVGGVDAELSQRGIDVVLPRPPRQPREPGDHHGARGRLRRLVHGRERPPADVPAAHRLHPGERRRRPGADRGGRRSARRACDAPRAPGPHPAGNDDRERALQRRRAARGCRARIRLLHAHAAEREPRRERLG